MEKSSVRQYLCACVESSVEASINPDDPEYLCVIHQAHKITHLWEDMNSPVMTEMVHTYLQREESMILQHSFN